ncbi:fimbrial protein [Enterobacter mori]|uniref:fimbrial protein n=1 Tax=Enterobacter mori TaxID=539813 RepID=UPI003B83AC61
MKYNFLIFSLYFPAFVPLTNAADITITTTATLTVESCTINNGSDTFVDFGVLAQELFNSPNQIPPQMVTMPMTCEGMAPDTSLVIRMNANPSAQNPDTVATTNPDLGIALSDGNDLSDSSAWIPPNSGTLPVTLAGGKTDIILYAVPVRTGGLPAEGPFDGTMTLSVEYP